MNEWMNKQKQEGASAVPTTDSEVEFSMFWEISGISTPECNVELSPWENRLCSHAIAPARQV